MSRDVPYSEIDICDECGHTGAFDFMGDLLCEECAKKYIKSGDEPEGAKHERN